VVVGAALVDAGLVGLVNCVPFVAFAGPCVALGVVVAAGAVVPTWSAGLAALGDTALGLGLAVGLGDTDSVGPVTALSTVTVVGPVGVPWLLSAAAEAPPPTTTASAAAPIHVRRLILIVI
jgi:hypothetical protein